MNDEAFENKVNRDVDQVKKDLTTLKDDGASGFTRIKKALYTLGDDGITGLSRKFEQMADEKMEFVADAVKTLNKDVGHSLRKYNTKVQEVADRVPGGLNEKTAKYPWVAVSIALVAGFMLGNFLKPTRQTLR